MTPGDVITEVRNMVSDTLVPYRYSDAVLLGFVNQTIRRIVSFRPDVFSYVGDVVTTPDLVLQSLPSNAVRLVEIFQVKNGNAVTEVNRETLDQMYPNWVGEASGTPINFMRHSRNPTKFFLYPKPAAGIILVAEYVRASPIYTIGQTIELLPDSFFPIVIDGTVFLAESVDNEHVNSNRAKLFYETFVSAIDASLGTRIVSDAESAAVSMPRTSSRSE